MSERVCVVAGAGAWPFYLATGAWVGQENRRFGNATRLGFYSGRQVQGLAPRIGHVVASVPLTPEEAATRTLSADPVERRVGEALAAALHDGGTAARVSVVLLSPPDDPETVSFDPVPARRRRRVDDVPAVHRRRPPARGHVDRRPRPGRAMTTLSREQRREEMRDWYEQHVDGLLALEAAFRDHLGDALRSARLEDARLETRTKALDSFVEKATKSDGRGGFKYADPATELTDFVGARVLVPLSADVAPVARLVQRLYVVEEMSDQRADSMLDVPGYQSLHFLVRFRDEDRDGARADRAGCSRPAGRGAGPLDPAARLGRVAARPDVQGRAGAHRPGAPPADRPGRPARAGRPGVHAVRLAHGDAAGLLDDSHAGGFDVAGVRAWAERLVGDEAGTEPLAWAAALRAVLTGLGATTAAGGDGTARRVGRPGSRAGADGAGLAALGHGVVRRRPGDAALPRRRLPRPARGHRPGRCRGPRPSSALRFARPWRVRRDRDPLRAGRDRPRRPGAGVSATGLASNSSRRGPRLCSPASARSC